MKPQTEWRLLDTGLRDAAENMALDKVLLESRTRGCSPNTLRFLQFCKPSVLLGYHQQLDQEVRLDFCLRNGVEVNRRITGGGTVLFEPTHIGWEIIAERRDPLFRSPPSVVTQSICNILCEALRDSFGIPASFRPRNDIEVRGRKISGTGGTEENGVFLFQGTLLVDLDVKAMLRALRVPTEKLKAHEIDSIMERVTTVRKELGWMPSSDAVKEAIIHAFSSALPGVWLPSDLNRWERRRLEECLPEFRSWSWIDQRAHRSQKREFLKVVHRGPGGIIRLMLDVDSKRRRIRSAVITGDFMTYPARALLDLESRFKDVPASLGTVQRILEGYFHHRGNPFLSLGVRDFVDAFAKALEKLAHLDMGFSPTETNGVFPVCGSIRDVLQTPFRWLLVPYCAKGPSCGLRYRDGCWECGECSVASGYALAHHYGLTPITVTSFEDLMRRLQSFSSTRGGFLGCCCEGFYVKHAEDFEKAKVPGILIAMDSTTCYDLGKARKARQGGFENQTELNISLLDKVLRLRRTLH